jgi:hypothetical protein
MEEGFLLENVYGQPLQARWFQGEPESSKWTGLKLSDKEKLLVQTFRCPSCGYLESYASSAGGV